jgi:Family of unknown function (DUF6545)
VNLIPDHLQFAIAAVMWIAVAIRFRLLLRARPEPGYRSFCFGLAFGLLTLTLNLPGIYSAVGELAGVPNLAYLLSLSSLCVGAFLLLPFYKRLADPAQPGTPTRTSAVVLGIAIASMATTFALMRAPDNVPPFMFLDPDAPFVSEFLFVSLVWLTGAFIVPLIRLHWRYRRMGSTFSTRLGWGRLAPAGFIVGAASHVHALLYSVSVRIDLPYPLASVAMPAYYALAFTTFILVAIGVALPTWGPRLGVEALYWRAHRYAIFHTLRALWVRLYAASPEIALLPPRSDRLGDIAALRDIDFHLNRRVVEIRDGILRLFPFCDAFVAEIATETCRELRVPAPERAYVVSATTLAAAIKAKADSKPVARRALLPIPDAESLDEEARNLAYLAAYGPGHPIVAQILERFDSAALLSEPGPPRLASHVVVAGTPSAPD